jgi:hypothetical protein
MEGELERSRARGPNAVAARSTPNRDRDRRCQDGSQRSGRRTGRRGARTRADRIGRLESRGRTYVSRSPEPRYDPKQSRSSRAGCDCERSFVSERYGDTRAIEALRAIGAARASAARPRNLVDAESSWLGHRARKRQEIPTLTPWTWRPRPRLRAVRLARPRRRRIRGNSKDFMLIAALDSDTRYRVIDPSAGKSARDCARNSAARDPRIAPGIDGTIPVLSGRDSGRHRSEWRCSGWHRSSRRDVEERGAGKDADRAPTRETRTSIESRG